MSAAQKVLGIGKFAQVSPRKKEHLNFASNENARGGVLPYIRYIGMCRPKGYGF